MSMHIICIWNRHIGTYSLDIERDLFLGSSSHGVKSFLVLSGTIVTPGCEDGTKVKDLASTAAILSLTFRQGIEKFSEFCILPL